VGISKLLRPLLEPKASEVVPNQPSISSNRLDYLDDPAIAAAFTAGSRVALQFSRVHSGSQNWSPGEYAERRAAFVQFAADLDMAMQCWFANIDKLIERRGLQVDRVKSPFRSIDPGPPS